MDPETLVTFLFRAPPDIRTVELLGSWDNFSRPYAMYNDRRRGPGFWSGCFKFQNIIFDGVEANWSRPRTGGLKQGGTYWYYFRLDDGMEAYDDSRECTTGCPLMPGQMVNVIYVPRDLLETPMRSRRASENLAGFPARVEDAHTMEPDDKFAALKPPALSKVHARCTSELALNKGLEEKPVKSKLSFASLRLSRDREKKERRASQRTTSLHRTGSSVYLKLCPSFSSQAQSDFEADVQALPPIPTCNMPTLSNSQSLHAAVSRPPTHLPETSGFDFQFSTPASGPDQGGNKSLSMDSSSHDPLDTESDAESIGPRSIANVQFLSDETSPSARDRKYSLHDADLTPQPQQNYLYTCSTSSSSPVYSPIYSGSPPRAGSPAHVQDIGSSPTFSAATVSSSGNGLNTPFYLCASETNPDPRAKTAWVNEDSFEDVAARLRSLEQVRPHRAPPPHPVQTYRPTGTLYMDAKAEMTTEYSLLGRKPSVDDCPRSLLGEARAANFSVVKSQPPRLAAGHGLGEEVSMSDAIFSELGYLRGAIS